MTDELTKIGLKYKTDKSGRHSYTNVYHKYFNSIRNDVKKVLEIGILEGASLRMWEEYFPNATIYGIDIKKVKLDSSRIITYKGSQNNDEDLSKFIQKYGGDFDIIIDDGSHRMLDQQFSLGFLFPYVKSGGYYIIEDLGTSFYFDARYGTSVDLSNTTYRMLELYNKRGCIKSLYMTKKNRDHLLNNIQDCDLLQTYESENNLKYQNSIIAFIKKKA